MKKTNRASRFKRWKGEKQWPIAVHVICEQAASTQNAPAAAKQVKLFMDRLYSQLSGGERAARVPIRLWSTNARNGKLYPPSPVPLERASRNLVVVLVDQLFFENRVRWKSYITALARQTTQGRDLILPVAIHADAARVAKEFRDINHVISEDPARWTEDERIFQWIYTSVLRLLVGDLPKIFLCHAKSGGVDVAMAIRRYIYEHTQLACFFDRHDIPHGHSVQASIEDAIEGSMIVTIWTDKLLESPWCQLEIIEARRRQRPMLIVDALTTNSPRLFPFLGNMPVVRWNTNPGFVVSLILLELIRAHHLEKVFEGLKAPSPDFPKFGFHPPDLVDSNIRQSGPKATARRTAPNVFVYPDPPIKSGELQVLYQSFPRTRFLSLNEWQALNAANALRLPWDRSASARPEPLWGMNVGISVSASDTWSEIGLTQEHQEDLAFNIALQLILLGAKVAWGGDLRPDGFGSQLRQIVQAYQAPNRPAQDHVAMTIPYSSAKDLKPEELAARRAFADVRLMGSPLPEGEGSANLADSQSPESRALVALALSVMRTELAGQCDARVILGGGLRRFQGLYPGIAEEACQTVRVGRPLYILGGFGGAARSVYDAIIDGSSNGAAELLRASLEVGAASTEAVRRTHGSFVALTRKPELAFDPKDVVSALSGLGPEGLSKANGLTKDQNECLSLSQDINEITGLVVRGLSICKTPAKAKR